MSRITYRSIFIIPILLTLTACTAPKVLKPYRVEVDYYQFPGSNQLINSRIGLRTLKGKIALEPMFENMTFFVRGNLVASLNGKKGVIDNKGRAITDFKYDDIGYFSEDGLASVTLNGKSGFIDTDGKEVIAPKYENARSFVGGYTRVKKNGKWGFIDVEENVIIPFDYEDFEGWLSDSIIGAKKNGLWGFIDIQNNIVIPFKYAAVNIFSEGLALVEDRYCLAYSYVNYEDEPLTSFIYDYPDCSMLLGKFKNDLGPVRFEGKSGYVNRKGKVVIPIRYDCLSPFYNGFSFARLEIEEKGLYLGYIDTIGQEYLYPSAQLTGSIAVSLAPPEIPDHSYLLQSDSRPMEKPWTLQKVMALAVENFRQSPLHYPDLKWLNRACVSYGLMAGGSELQWRIGWDQFKKETLFEIIKSEKLREITWNWLKPHYREAFENMHPLHQKSYKEIALYMKNYIIGYDKRKTIAYLKDDQKEFAFKSQDGKIDQYRKLSAFVDRLIIIHKVLSVKDAQIWITKIADEVLSWETQPLETLSLK